MLRNPWRQQEQEALREAMGDLKAANRAEDVAAVMLPRVASMVGGDGAALLDEAGTPVGAHGQIPGLEEPHAARPGLLRIPLSTGALLVWASPYAPVFGRQELELLGALGSLTELALERVRTAERDSQLAAVVAADGDAIVSTGLDGVVRSWNPAAEATYGRSAEEAVGRPLSAVVSPDDPGELAELLRRVGEGESVRLETQRLRSDGERIDVALTAAPLRNRADAVVGVSVIARDVSEVQRAQRLLAEAKEEADRANHAKSEYLSRMSHELRTPLNAILGFGQLLELDELSDVQQDNVDHILAAARHLLELINEVLDIAAIEAGRLPLSVEPVGLADVVGEAVVLIRPLADEHNVLMEVGSTPLADQHVLADRQRLKQILLNLLSNAVKYNREGGCPSASPRRWGDPRHPGRGGAAAAARRTTDRRHPGGRAERRRQAGADQAAARRRGAQLPHQAARRRRAARATRRGRRRTPALPLGARRLPVLSRPASGITPTPLDDPHPRPVAASSERPSRTRTPTSRSSPPSATSQPSPRRALCRPWLPPRADPCPPQADRRVPAAGGGPSARLHVRATLAGVRRARNPH
jgi:PAS domain S-box-containing protein